ncbi:MAG: glycosyltransferase family 2 protein [Chloroflexi bacterium]|nr:glycosyltransferase family 2 protein [Chloroflexota bacterium]
MPKQLDGFVQRLALLEAEQQWDAVVDACQQWLIVYPNNSYHPYANQVHKHLIHALIEQGSLEAAFSAYQLVRQDRKAPAISAGELLCCVVVRNEALRLPYFLAYYRQKGVTRFLIVDNGSTDETLAYLLAQADVYVWSSTYSFKAANFGAAWFELLLQRYGIGHWVLLVDADELLYYPGCEQTSLLQLCDELRRQDVKAYRAILLDMYSDKAIRETHYTKGEDFLSVCPYFDRRYYHVQALFQDPHMNQIGYSGGVRRRVFGGTQWSYCLNKVPLLYYSPACVLTGGQHATNYPSDKISSDRGCVLHFKFFSSFLSYAATEAIRQEHAGDALEYRHYAAAIADEQALTLYDPAQSLRFQDSHQLIELGIMQRQPADDNPQESRTKLLMRRTQITAYIKLAETWFVKGDLQRVLAYYEKIIELDPQCLPAYLRLAYILQENGRFVEARSYAVQALTLAPDNIPLQNMADNLAATLAGRACDRLVKANGITRVNDVSIALGHYDD